MLTHLKPPQVDGRAYAAQEKTESVEPANAEPTAKYLANIDGRTHEMHDD